MIEKTISPPWLELFARRHVTGWDCYGNQLAPLVGLDDRDQLNAAD
jgi:N6-adenosine-specific RNA methylase IME4